MWEIVPPFKMRLTQCQTMNLGVIFYRLWKLGYEDTSVRAVILVGDNDK